MNCKDTQNLIQPNNAYHRFADRKVLNLLRYLIGQWFFRLMRDWNTLTSKYVYLNVSLVEKKWTFINILREVLVSLESGTVDQVWLEVIARTKRSVFAQGGIDEEEAASNVAKRQQKPFFRPIMGNFSHQLFYCWFFWDRIIHFCPWNCMAMNLVNLIREGSVIDLSDGSLPFHRPTNG